MPRRPAWAAGRGVEVRLQFEVREDGTVERVALARRGSGIAAVDRLAVETLRRWRFQPLHAGVGLAIPASWGIVSFRFFPS